MSTKTDAVILTLLAKWQALAVPAGTLANVEVVDGPQASEDASTDWLFVGYDGSPPSKSSEVSSAKQTLLAWLRTKEETADVKCAAVVVSGDLDVPTARARAFTIVGAAEDALRQDITLGGTVLQCYISAHTYDPVIDSVGTRVRVGFTVTYAAQI